MQVGLIGLGKMGAFMAERLLLDNHQVIAFDINKSTVKTIGEKGASGVFSIEELIESLAAPRIVWLMVPVGDPVQKTIDALIPHLSKNDIIIDGGNSFYKDSHRRADELRSYGIHFLDVGTSGGVWGLKEGYCLMVGGNKKIFDHCEPLFQSLAPPNGYRFIGPNGAGHFVKMIHNGIEYGLMQAYAEGFDIMKESDYRIDLPAVADLWGNGSVVRSWLLELLANALQEDPKLEYLEDYVEDSGMGRWTVAEAIDKNVPAPILTHSLIARIRSRQAESFSAKILAALRNQFGGHSVREK